MECDVAIAGGGPAGLAAAIESARRGLSTVVFERRTDDLDKACGEGLLPRGVRALERLGALGHLDPTRHARLEGIRFVQENGSAATGRFHSGFGLGIRRIALRDALLRAALASGATVLHGRSVLRCEQTEDAVRLATDDGAVSARVLVVADGLQSPLRRRLGLDRPRPGARAGLRAHFQGVETGAHVEVHWAEGVEAYLTPVGVGRLGVAFLFDSRAHRPASFEALLRRFPAIGSRVRRGAPDSDPRGAGPFDRRARAVVQGRVVLLGDAAGYVDAITGEGLSLAFESARALGSLLPAALTTPARLAAYGRAHARLLLAFRCTAGALVALSRHPPVRRGALTLLTRVPGAFDALLRLLE